MNFRCNVPVKANSCNKSYAHALTVLHPSSAVAGLSWQCGALEHCTDSNFTFLLAELIAGCWYRVPLNVGRETDSGVCCLQPQWHRLQCALSLWHWSEQGSVSEALGVRYSNSTGSQWLSLFKKLMAGHGCLISEQQAPRVCLMGSWYQRVHHMWL